MASPADANAPFDVALDAMGGDHAPRVEVEAALRAARRGVRIVLVGDEPKLHAELHRQGGALPAGCTIHHAPEAIGMHEKPSQAVRKKRGASVRVAADLVKEGKARAMVSAGNSGAVMAAGLFSLGRVRGVQRPALAAPLPTLKKPMVVLDLGANVDPTPIQLAQFGVLGEAYARVVLGHDAPRVALLTNGSEEVKGSDLTRAANEVLQRTKLNYVGYCEGRDVWTGDIDVVITDGFTGNVVLKTLEGFVSAMKQLITAEVKASLLASAGAVLMRDVLVHVKDKIDYEQAGGAPLLGLKRRAIVAHGGSTANALEHAIHAAHRLAGSPLVEAIEESIRAHADLGLWSTPKNGVEDDDADS